MVPCMSTIVVPRILTSTLSLTPAVSTHCPPPSSTPLCSFSFLFSEKGAPRPVTRQCSKAAIIPTAFHRYDNTLWGLQAIETLRETGNFIPPGKFIYFLHPSVISRGGLGGGGGGWRPAKSPTWTYFHLVWTKKKELWSRVQWEEASEYMDKWWEED